ncbi:putative G-protein coupled receptor Mth-like 11 [Cochliomyia hominivorax]
MILKWLLIISLLILSLKQNQSYVNGEFAEEHPNCPFEDTINITDALVLPNGSYWHDNQTLIASNLVHTYNYEILYNNTKRTVAPHKRACICQLQSCIPLCSTNITSYYYEFLEYNRSDLLHIYNISVSQRNGKVVEKNIMEDFSHNILSEFCTSRYPLSPETDKNLYSWTLFENGSLLRHTDKYLMKRTEYCFDIYFENDIYPLIDPMNCAKSRKNLEIMEEINYWIQVFSIIFCVITFYVYCKIPRLLGGPGKCFLTYIFSLTLSYSIFSFINLTGIILHEIPCVILGYLNQFLQLSHYTWLGLICYNTWKTIKNGIYYPKFSSYAKIGFSIPLIITAISWCVQHTVIDEEMKPGISESRCGLDVSKWKAAIYLYGYCLIVLIWCLILFFLTTRNIEKSKEDVKDNRPRRPDEGKFSYIIYFRLFFLMGLSWFLDVISFILQVTHHEKISSAVDYINSLQGFFIFINLISRKDFPQALQKNSRQKYLRTAERKCAMELLSEIQNSTNL